MGSKNVNDLTISIQGLQNALLSMNRVLSKTIIKQEIERSGSIEMVEHLLTPVLEEIGALWERGEVALSQVYMSGCICEEIINEILPVHAELQTCRLPIAIAVLEDSHALGKRLVLAALRSVGLPVKDYGAGVTVEQLVEQVRQDKIEILLVSALMLRSALKVAELVKKLHAANLQPRILVGGAPFRMDPELWREVGADAVAMNSAEAIRLVRDLLDSKGKGGC